jgi:hypothetical protein
MDAPKPAITAKHPMRSIPSEKVRSNKRGWAKHLLRKFV